jgi:hypothetical protein
MRYLDHVRTLGILSRCCGYQKLVQGGKTNEPGLAWEKKGRKCCVIESIWNLAPSSIEVIQTL